MAVFVLLSSLPLTAYHLWKLEKGSGDWFNATVLIVAMLSAGYCLKIIFGGN